MQFAGRNIGIDFNPRYDPQARSGQSGRKGGPDAVQRIMIANCDVLITKYSSVAYVGMEFGKEVHSYFNEDDLKKLMPIQNNGTSAERIARIGIHLLESPNSSLEEIHETFDLKTA